MDAAKENKQKMNIKTVLENYTETTISRLRVLGCQISNKTNSKLLTGIQVYRYTGLQVYKVLEQNDLGLTKLSFFFCPHALIQKKVNKK